MSKKKEQIDWDWKSPEFIFEVKAAFNDKVFLEEVKAERNRLFSIGKDPKYIGGMLDLWCAEKIEKRLNNPPEPPEFH